MKKGLLIIIICLIGMILLLAGGAADSVKRGAGFLFIPSFTPSATNTLTPSATFTNTATEKPTATFTLTPSMTPEPTATATLIPTDTPTPLPTFDETAFAGAFYQEMTATAEAYLFMQTPSLTPTLPDHELLTGLRMVNLTDGKELMFVRNDSDKTRFGFWVDRNEVTNAEYRACVASGNCSAPLSGSCAGEMYYYEDEAYNEYPVVNVTRVQASDYCSWAGMRLISLKDWETAADIAEDKGGNYDRVFNQPMKNSPDASHFYGNVWEWTSDSDSSGEGVIAGGSWKTSLRDIHGKRIGKISAQGFAEDIGFRCISYVP